MDFSHDDVERFARLFRGRTDNFGHGGGGWTGRALGLQDYAGHLAGKGKGIGIAPLLDDGTCWFAAIDLDDDSPEAFEACSLMQEFLNFGDTFIERSRSGNAHLWVFFEDPIEAWVVRGVLKEAVIGAGLPPKTEVFPKQDKLVKGMLGNYINLPFHGDARPVIEQKPGGWWNIGFENFLDLALGLLNRPDAWRKRADMLLIAPPEERYKDRQEHGTGKELHMCAEWIIANRDENPITEGHRATVFFNLSKMLSHYEGFDTEDEVTMLRLVNDASPDPIPDAELLRIHGNAHRGEFTSTGCDDPLMSPYVHPDCPIAHS